MKYHKFNQTMTPKNDYHFYFPPLQGAPALKAGEIKLI